MNTYSKHLAAITSGKVTKTNVIGIRKALNNFERKRRGYSTSSTAPKVTQQELNDLLFALRMRKPEVQGELLDSGVKLLQSKRYRKQLSRVSDIIGRIASIHLVKFTETGSCQFTPVYQVQALDGAAFNYTCQSWQSGGNGPQVVELF